MSYDEEDFKPSRPIPKVTIVSAPGKPRIPDDWGWLKRLQGEGGEKSDDDGNKDGDEGGDQDGTKDQGEVKDQNGTKDQGGKDKGGSKDQKMMEPCKVTGEDDEEELVDPQVRLKECCTKSEECTKLRELFEECNDRVNSKEKTAETCEMELFDFLHCVDHCVSKDLFAYLK